MSRRKRRRPTESADNTHGTAETAVPRRSRKLLYSFVVAAVAIAIGVDIWWMLQPDEPPVLEPADARPLASSTSYVGNEICAGCHAGAYSQWKNSQHARAMEHASLDSVLGDFEDAKFQYSGVTSTFFQRDGKFFVRTDGADGKLDDFEIAYTFGVDPLQQYLIAFPDGRMQALSIAWDTRPEEQGGQRWFHLYPDEKVDHLDELHWTRRSQNWNFMCADCHSTDIRKGYDAKTDTFKTTWTDITVGCEACHGPGSAHVQWAQEKSLSSHKGLVAALDERSSASWVIETETGTALRNRPRDNDAEIDVCAQCHARRSQIAEGYRAGLPFLDFYRPALLSPGLYHADGQQRDEVYIWGSFLQSRMYHAGVTCSDCHEPHTQQLRAPGNEVCGQCHLPTKFDNESHHHHAGKNSEGSRCVDCHMPETTYMVVDPRRDHSLRVPRPDLTLEYGIPNACNECHHDRDAAWAIQNLEQWYGHQPKGFQNYSAAFTFAQRRSAEAAPSLARIARDQLSPAIAQATAIELLADHPSPQAVSVARQGLRNDSALVRRASIFALSALPPAQRLELLAPLLDDPVRTVRTEAASALADAVGKAGLRHQKAFERAASEYESTLKYNADRPESRASLGNFYARRGRLDEAHAQLQSAIDLEPSFVPAYVNLADLLRTRGRDAAA